ncbi:unnamed protein product [Brachionus calyciflorus]|uniref:TLDc domain-containing protein n=1 Tax=Brachionus calyciflorus TaxID=104777 RepID=A0A813RL88_9BILA|nr:unnamed protein product [Brachionus calyciflorus]
MNESLNEAFNSFEDKLNIMNEDFSTMKKTAQSLIDRVKTEKENNQKMIDTFKKFESIESDIVRLNVGGQLFSTLKSTLTKKIKNESGQFYSPTMFEGLVNGFVQPKYDENQAIFIDRNPKYFSYILDYLRIANTETDFELPDNVDKKDLRKEAKYYNIEGLLEMTDTKLLKSNILTSDSAKDLMKLCGFPESEKWFLVYRGSKDGFGAKDFHAKCDGVAKTLTVVKTANGNVFGGYTEAAWSQTGSYKSDPNAFLFSLVNKRTSPVKIKISHGYDSYSIYCSSHCGPTFGGGHDLYISDNCNTTTSNYSNLGHSYKHSGIVYGTTESNTFLADSYNFQVSEIEIFARK